MGQPLVSIMIPTYNQAHWLKAAVDSALAQDYPNTEIVISNDRSTDTTAEILDKYQDITNVKIFTNGKNLGRVANYKHTLENYATGEWVVNLDGDDYFTDKSFISSAIEQINKEKNVVFVQAGHSITNAEGHVLQSSLPNIEGDIQIVEGKDYFLNFHHFSHLASLYSRQAAMDTGFYLHDVLSTDIECFLRLALRGNVVLMRRSVGAWVHHAANESKKLSVDAVEKNMIRFRAPYAYAKQTASISVKLLDEWLTKKTNEYLLNYLTIYFANSAQIPGYLGHVLKTYPHIKVSPILPKAFLKGSARKVKNLFQSKN